MPETPPPVGKLQGFISCKCPKCRSGKVFTHSAISLKFYESYENCPVCNIKFEKETGYYWAAMYISYGFSAGLMLFLGILSISMDLPFSYIYKLIIPIAIIITPFSFRYSRMLLLYFISPFKFDPDAWKNKEKNSA